MYLLWYSLLGATLVSASRNIWHAEDGRNRLQLGVPSLGTLHSLEDFLRLPYFQFLACLGHLPLHPGAPRSTERLVQCLDIKLNSEVLEIGSGTGWVTRELLRAGVRLAVVEPDERMRQTTLNACESIGRYPQRMFECGVEELGLQSPPESYSHILMQSVFAFIGNKQKAIDTMRQALKPGGKLGVIDYHYVTTPAGELLDQLEGLLGARITPLSEAQWKDMFSSLSLSVWEEWPLKASEPTLDKKIEHIQFLTKNSPICKEHWFTEDAVSVIAKKWLEWERVFFRNKQHLKVHIAIWEKNSK